VTALDRDAIAKEVFAILADLIAIDATYPPGNMTAIARYAADRLARAGYATEVIAGAPGVDNVVARLGKGAPSVVFNCHMDTVGPGDRAAWRTDPFVATLADGRVFGLGAGNCKGPMAAQLWAAEAIAKRGGPRAGELVWTFVGDEENLGPNGLAHLRKVGAVKPDLLVVGAQTENQLIVAERGVLWTRVRTRGRAAHAGLAPTGDSAILRMMRVIAALERDLAPKVRERRSGTLQSMMNVGRIAGGKNTNVVPDLCEIEIDRRLIPEEKVADAFAEIRAIALGCGEPEGTVEVEFMTGTNGFRGREDGRGVRAFAKVIEARTGKAPRFLDVVGVFDGRYFADDAGIEIIDFGPGEGHEGHAPNESTPLAGLVDAALIQTDLVGELLGLGR
jgi:acetylornithine deacetylase/succinyl-diaminopimelate desuccinylase family protein